MLRTFLLTLVAALLLACSKEPATPQAKAATKPAAAAAAAQPGQDAPKPQPKPEPKPEPAPAPKPEPAPAPASTPAPAPAAAGGKEDSMYGPQNLTDAKSPKVNEKAPDTFKAKFETNEGSFVIEVTRAWAPQGADRFYNLVRNGYFTDVRFFRAIKGFMVQFGIHGDPKLSAVWRDAKIKDDPVTQSNTLGMVTFAMAGKDTRTTQLFINLVDNANLDGMGFPPFGKVVEGMDVVNKLHTGYGEGAPRGKGPEQGRIQMEGNAYLEKSFPELDYIVKATIE
jgi:peptidyl-prolyl cis-trans isomerase A (cyclophilin A)